MAAETGDQGAAGDRGREGEAAGVLDRQLFVEEHRRIGLDRGGLGQGGRTPLAEGVGDGDRGRVELDAEDFDREREALGLVLGLDPELIHTGLIEAEFEHVLAFERIELFGLVGANKGKRDGRGVALAAGELLGGDEEAVEVAELQFRAGLEGEQVVLDASDRIDNFVSAITQAKMRGEKAIYDVRRGRDVRPEDVKVKN